MEKQNKMKTALTLILCGLIGCLSACTQELEPIDYGHDICVQCKMTILDNRFAAEMVTRKGKAYKFDDIGCLLKYTSEQHDLGTNAIILIADYKNPDNRFIDAHQATFLHNEFFKTPMNGNYAAFANVQNAMPLKDSLHTELLKWENLKK